MEKELHDVLVSGSHIERRLFACIVCALCASATVCAPSVILAQGLDDAYEAELIRLKAEKVAMRRTLKKSEARAKASRKALVSEIEGLARTLTELRADNTKQEMLLPQATRLGSMQDQQEGIERRKEQIETWLETHRVNLPQSSSTNADTSGEHQHPELDVMVVAALEHVEEHGQLWLRSKQEYFGTDGTSIVGRVLRIGEVGAVAVDEGFRPLELASDGSLRLTEHFAPTSLEHQGARTVGVILFDPSDIRPAITAESDWRSWLERGGVVMWAIAALALVAVLIFTERTLAYLVYLWRLIRFEKQGPTHEVSETDRLLRAVAIIQTRSGPIQEVEEEAAEAVQDTQMYVRRGVSILALVASVAPLLGLLGTVTGMIGTFAMITEHGTGDPRILSGGISEALLTTQFGLMVAIPALLFQAILYRFGDAIVRRLEMLALAVLHEGEDGIGGGVLRRCCLCSNVR